jgi:hypothetical protein
MVLTVPEVARGPAFRLDHPASTLPLRGPPVSRQINLPMTSIKPSNRPFTSRTDMFCKQRKNFDPTTETEHATIFSNLFLVSSKGFIFPSFGRAVACHHCGVDY